MAGAFLVSPQRGARTSIHLATNPDVAQISGQSFGTESRQTISKAPD